GGEGQEPVWEKVRRVKRSWKAREPKGYGFGGKLLKYFSRRDRVELATTIRPSSLLGVGACAPSRASESRISAMERTIAPFTFSPAFTPSTSRAFHAFKYACMAGFGYAALSSS